MDTHKVDQHTRTGHEHHPASRPPAADAGGVRHAGRVRHHWHDDSVSRIDPATNRVAGSPIPIGAHHAGNLVVGAGDLWVSSDYRVDGAAEDTVVVRIDAQTNRAVETIAVGGHPIDVAAAGGAVWVSVANPGRLLRIAGRKVRGVGPVLRNPARPAVRVPLGLTYAVWCQQPTLTG
jgi:hypothetical protein